MKVTGRGTIYHNQYGYTITDNQKKQDGTWENYYIPISFPRNMQDLPHNRDFVEIDGYTKPYKYKDGKVGISYMVLNWKISEVNGSTANNVVNTSTETKQDVVPDPYQNFAEEFPISDDDLPF